MFLVLLPFTFHK